MGLFGGGNTTTKNTSTITTNVAVDPDIGIEFDFNSAGEQISTVITQSAKEFNGTLDNALKTVSSIALLWVVSKSLK